MPVPQFILDYSGNKYRESKETEKLNINYDKYETIIEPFGGSFGFSRYLYEKKGLTHLNYIIYDYDKDLIDFYNYLKDLINKGEHLAFIDEYNNEVKKMTENCIYEKNTRYNFQLLNAKKLIDYLNRYTHKNIFIIYLLKKNHLKKATTCCKPCLKKNCGFIELIKNATFIHSKFENINDAILNDPKTFVYLDPPYIATDNSAYDTQFNINEIFKKIQNIFKTTDCLMVHQYNFLLCMVFQDIKQIEYVKRYGGSCKKIVKHVFFYNF